MKILIYPHKKFLSSMNFEIGNGTDIHIKLSNDWNTKLITPKIINLLINENSEEKSWKYLSYLPKRTMKYRKITC